MVAAEKLIAFKMPDWNRVTPPAVDAISQCFCYQYDIDDKGYGPYGFNTINAKKLLDNTFGMISLYDNETATLKVVESVSRKGLYFFGDSQQASNQLTHYLNTLKKNALRKKKGLPEGELPQKPVFMSADDDGLIKKEAIVSRVEDGFHFFIVNHYQPEAGVSIIIFNDELSRKLMMEASLLGIGVEARQSIDELMSW